MKVHIQKLTYRLDGEKGQDVKPTYNISIRCFFTGRGNYTTHRQDMQLKDLPKWLETYIFTHPNVESITVKLWTKDGKEAQA